jgi:hypothetical protein
MIFSSGKHASPCVVHHNPRYIEIGGYVMKRAITCVECWGYDVFDIAIRRVQQLDRGMYPANIIYRLLLESDFAVSTPSCQQFFLPCFYFANIIYFEECTPASIIVFTISLLILLLWGMFCPGSLFLAILSVLGLEHWISMSGYISDWQGFSSELVQ